MNLIGDAMSSVVGYVKDSRRGKGPVISSEFRNNNTFTKRREESTRILVKYPDRIPVICEIAKEYRSLINLDRHKYLVPLDITVAQLVYVLRGRIQLTPEKALFLFTENNMLPPTSETLGALYNRNKNEDGFLYIIVSLESTFG